MLLASMLTACQHVSTAGPKANHVACRSFERIYASDDDTPGTLNQVDGHNAAYDAICGKPEKD